MYSPYHRLLQERIDSTTRDEDRELCKIWLPLLDSLESATAEGEAVVASLTAYLKALESTAICDIYTHNGMVEQIVDTAVNLATQAELDKAAAQDTKKLVCAGSARLALREQIALAVNTHDHLLSAFIPFKERDQQDRTFTPEECRQTEQHSFFVLEDLRSLWQRLTAFQNDKGPGLSVCLTAIFREAELLQTSLRETGYSSSLSGCIENRSIQAPKPKVPGPGLQNLILVELGPQHAAGTKLLALARHIADRLPEIKSAFDSLRAYRGRIDLRRLSDQVLAARYELEATQKAALAYDRPLSEYHDKSIDVHYLTDALRPFLFLAVRMLPQALEEALKADQERPQALNNCLCADSILRTAAIAYFEISDYRNGDELFFKHGVYAHSRRYHQLNRLIREKKLVPLGR